MNQRHSPGAAQAVVTIYGATGNGRTDDTVAINRAIDACADLGGGMVAFPPGRYLVGTIHLRSHVMLHLHAGCRLVGTPDPNAYESLYPATPDGKGESRWHRAMILGRGVSDVAIVGDGIIDGAKVFDAKGEEGMRGPHTIMLGDGADVRVRDVTIVDSANYAIFAERVDRLEVRNVVFRGGWDGVHVRGTPDRPCRGTSIIGCDFQTGDDAIAGRYWDEFVLADCQINSSCNGVRVIGPATKLIIHGCLFYGPGRHEHRTQSRLNMLAGILLQPGSWDATTGDLDDVLISDVTMRDVQCPVALYSRPGNRVGRVVVERLSATGVYHAPCSFESWAENSIEEVVLRDVAIDYTAAAVQSTHAAVPLAEPKLGVRPLPAWGLFAYRVKRLRAERVRMTIDGDDARPAVAHEQVGTVDEADVRATKAWPRG